MTASHDHFERPARAPYSAVANPDEDAVARWVDEGGAGTDPARYDENTRLPARRPLGMATWLRWFAPVALAIGAGLVLLRPRRGLRHY